MVKAEDLMKYENELLAKGYKYICGVDEVGRGPLAGPVCVCAVIMPLDDLIQGVNDSKKVSKAKREKLFNGIKEKAIAYKCVLYDNNKIDEVNILNATKQAMKEAILSLDVKPDIVLIDAVKLDIPYESMPIIHGDAISYSIGAASILAKVTRDTLMEEYAKQYPEYDFEHNMGYGTKKHIEALKQYGPTPIHRQTFIQKFIK
ncbi:MAG: ribonuclease HII [Clostridia bacterium]|nr:ribonuclease HII [Clostridia bacterium]